MFKHALFVSLLVCASKLAAAVVPPACILSCVNTQENPADLKSVCGSAGSKAVQKCLLDTCPDFVAKEAPQYFASVCNDAGHQIVLVSPSPTSSSATGASATSTDISTTGTDTSTSKPTSTSESSTDDDEDTSKGLSGATTSASADATEESDAAGKEDEDSSAPSIAFSQTALAVALLGVSSFIAMI